MEQSLYNIREEHLQLLRDLEEAGGELTEELQKRLELTEHDFNNKAVSYGYIMKRYEDNADIIDKEIKRLQALKESTEKKKKAFAMRLADAMEQFKIQKIDTSTMVISIKKTKAVLITGLEEIPNTFMRQPPIPKPEPDKVKIKAAIEAGEKVPGALVATNTTIQIK